MLPAPIPVYRCTLCPRVPGRKPVQHGGPIPCPLLFISEAPSWNEDKADKISAGRDGAEFDRTYLPIAGLGRHQIYITNARLCSDAEYEIPTPEQCRSCSWMNLGAVMDAIQPVIVIPMGASACSLFPEIGKVSLQHGIPLPGKYGIHEFVLWPTFNPRAGIVSTGFMIPMMEDFDKLGKFIKEIGLQL